jgi:hypothetical protein
MFASLYSVISLTMAQMLAYRISPYLTVTAITFMPLLYFLTTFETDFKRYRCYLNEK